MGKREKVMFTIFVVIVQVLQFLLVYSIAWLNNQTIEFLFIFFSFQMNRMVFGKSYHADSLSKCTLITLVTFYLLIKGVIPLNISLFATPLFGVYLSYVLNIIQELIDNQEVPKPFVKKRLREQIIEILGEDLSEEHINEICRAKGINPKVAETATKRLNSLVIKGNTVQESTSDKPSPSPEYPQEIKAVNELSGVMSGKNLLKPFGSYPRTDRGITFNLMNDGIHVNGKCISSNSRTFIYSDTLQAGTYYINGIKGASNSRYQVVLYKNNVIITYVTTNNYKLELKEKAKIELSLFIYPEYGTFNDLVLPYMICRNENDLYLYTPYQGQSLLNYTLQNPLYKIGDVYDYIDFNRGKIIRNVGVVTFDGSDDELWNKYSNNVSMDGYSVNVSNAIDTTPCICNKLLTTDAISTTLEEAIKVLDNAMYVVLNKIRGLNTTELFKSWLQSNPITVCYQLATPTEKDIPQELLTQLKQLQTYSGKTNISFEASDVYPTIDLEYIKDTKKYIESKEELDNQSIIDIDYRVTCLELDMEEQ